MVEESGHVFWGEDNSTDWTVHGNHDMLDLGQQIKDTQFVIDNHYFGFDRNTCQ